MPKSAPHPCSYPACKALTDSRFCEAHRQQVQRQYESQRGTRTERGYNNRWLRASKTFLSRNPLCVACKKNNRIEPATVTDHIVPHKGDQSLFWNTSNWQPLCKRCHDSKTAREDGRWGGGIKSL